MGAKRVKDLVAAWMVGNGALMFIAPRQRALLWVIGPGWVRKLALWYADHPAIISALLATHVRRQVRLDLPPLLIAQPE